MSKRRSKARKLTRLSDVQPAALGYVWHPRIPRRAITLLESDPGLGKSTVIYDWIGRITTGRPMPGDEQTTTPATVLLLQGEDQVSSTVRSALESAGADLDRVIVYDRDYFTSPLLLPDDLGVLEAAVVGGQVSLIVIDPVATFLNVNANSSAAVRGALLPLVALAERADLGVLLVRHLTKNENASPLYRGGGAIDFIAAARSALLVARDPTGPEDASRRLLVQIKTNLAPAPTLSFQLVRRGNGVGIEWGEASQLTWSEITRRGRVDRPLLEEAKQILFDILAVGPMASEAAIALAVRGGIAKRTLDRARAELDVRSEHVGFGPGSRWMWSLPPAADPRLTPYRRRYDCLHRPENLQFASAPEWLLANDGCVRRMAEEIAQSGNMDELPALADALELAGCEQQQVLAHLRHDPHWPGCWVISALLATP